MEARVAVVGAGIAGFTAYQSLRRAFEPGEIAVFGTDADPAAAWRVRAAAIRQREMRSESDGHCLPTSFPGLAFGSVRSRRSPRPLLESALDRYHPTVDEFLSHVERLRERSGWDESVVLCRVERVQAVDGGFELNGDRFRHVLIAPGHPGLNVPEELRDDPRAVHSYEPHDYAGTVTVVGAGLAAATEWLNALAAGAGGVGGPGGRGGGGGCRGPGPGGGGCRSTPPGSTSRAAASLRSTACRSASESSVCARWRRRRIRPDAVGTSRSSAPRARAGSG